MVPNIWKVMGIVVSVVAESEQFPTVRRLWPASDHSEKVFLLFVCMPYGRRVGEYKYQPSSLYR